MKYTEIQAMSDDELAKKLEEAALSSSTSASRWPRASSTTRLASRP